MTREMKAVITVTDVTLGLEPRSLRSRRSDLHGSVFGG